MLYYILFWTLLAFIIHFYIIFGTNLLTGGPTQNCFFAYFRVSQKKNIKRSPKGMKPSGTWFLERTWSRRLGPYVKEASRRPRGRGRALHRRGPHVAPPTYFFPIYVHVPWKHRGNRRNPNSTAVIFCSREIPSRGLFRSSAGGGIDHGVLLHHHHLPHQELWVVYHRPSGP